MANSKYEYVRAFERDEHLLPNTWIVVRIDGRGFHKLSKHYSFAKPNDSRALNLMNAAAVHVLSTISDIVFAYGVSDEYSFVFSRDTTLFERRRDKLCSTVVSTFTAAYVAGWGKHFGHNNDGQEVRSEEEGAGVEAQANAQDGRSDGKEATAPFSQTPTATATTTTTSSTIPQPQSQSQPLSLSHLPTFDARAILYPTTANLRDYLSWRQVDCHINNLYNTTFWALVQQGGITEREAEQELKGTVAADKNEILWGRFGVNYNACPVGQRKGGVVFWDRRGSEGEGQEVESREEEGVKEEEGEEREGKGDEDDEHTAESKESNNDMSKTTAGKRKGKLTKKEKKAKNKGTIVLEHVDIIKDEFWEKRPWILGGKNAR